jgi:hypothetical protein
LPHKGPTDHQSAAHNPQRSLQPNSSGGQVSRRNALARDLQHAMCITQAEAKCTQVLSDGGVRCWPGWSTVAK